MNLSATMNLQAGAFLGPLKQVQGNLSTVVGHIKGLVPVVTGLAGAFAAFKSAESIVEGFFAAFEKGHALEKMSRITGESVKDLVVLQKALSAAGVDSGDLQRQLVMLQKSLGGVNEQGEPTKAIFEQMGLSIEQLAKQSAPEQLEAIGEKLRALPTAAQRTATAMAVFGRSGAEMIAVLDDPNALVEAQKSAAAIGTLYQNNAKIFSEITRLMAAIKGKAAGMFAGLAAGAAPAFKTILEWVKQIDLAKFGRDLGTIVRAIPAAIATGNIGELVSLTLSVGFAKAVNYFTATMKTALTVLGDISNMIFGNLGSITDVLVGAAAQFGAAMLKAVQEPLAHVQAFMEDLFDRDNDKKRSAAGLQASSEVNKQFGVSSKNEVIGLFGALTRTPEEDARLQAYNAALAKRTAQLEEEAGVISHNQRVKGIMAGGGPSFGFGGAAMNADQIAAAGRQRAMEGMTSLRAPLGDLAAKIAQAFKEFKVTDIAGAGPLAASLKALIDKLVPPGKGEAENRERGGAGLSGVGTGKIDSDRLAKIGGFIGGAGGPANNYARRTAENTAALVQHVKALPAQIAQGIVRGNYDGARAPLWQ